MPEGLVRYQRTGHFHLVTFCCLEKRPYLQSSAGRDLFERSLERMRVRYGFCVAAYVVMPNHVHLLMSEPKTVLLATALQALKLSLAVQSVRRPFWMARYYDFNVFSTGKRAEKIGYIHRNPVKRGLVAEPGDWAWSSYRHYRTGERGVVEIESEWTADRRVRGELESQVSEARPGAPGFVVG